MPPASRFNPAAQNLTPVITGPEKVAPGKRFPWLRDFAQATRSACPQRRAPTGGCCARRASAARAAWSVPAASSQRLQAHAANVAARGRVGEERAESVGGLDPRTVCPASTLCFATTASAIASAMRVVERRWAHAAEAGAGDARAELGERVRVDQSPSCHTSTTAGPQNCTNVMH
eukprot:3932469-Rhodomonas_salina.1